MTVEIDITRPYRRLVSKARLQAAVTATLEHEGAHGDVTLVITDDEAIAELNQRFLGNEGPTDVLSFPSQSSPAEGFALPPGAPVYLGDIVIAYPYAARQAEQQGHAIADEIDLLAVHGTLHLLGHDHAEAAEEAAMWARQATIVQHLGGGAA